MKGVPKMQEHPIEGLMGAAMDSIRDMISIMRQILSTPMKGAYLNMRQMKKH